MNAFSDTIRCHRVRSAAGELAGGRAGKHRELRGGEEGGVLSVPCKLLSPEVDALGASWGRERSEGSRFWGHERQSRRFLR